jgi:hypothetical protein
MEYRPSLVAVSAVFTAKKMLQLSMPYSSKSLFGFTQDQVKECAYHLAWNLNTELKKRESPVLQKYKLARYF